MKLPTKIETNRLRIFPMSEKYIEDVYRGLTIKNTEFMRIVVSDNITRTRQWYESISKEMKDGSDFTIAITNKKTGEFIGGGGLHHIDNPAPTISIWIKESVHGNGYGKEAVEAIIAWAESNLKYDYLIYPVAVRNIASCKIAESIGGKLYKKFYVKNGVNKRMLAAEYRIYR